MLFLHPYTRYSWLLLFYFCLGNSLEQRLPGEKRGSFLKEDVASGLNDKGPKYIFIIFFILLNILVQFLCDYINLESLLFSSFTWVTWTIVSAFSDAFFDLKGDLFLNTLGTFSLILKFKSLKLNRIRSCFLFKKFDIFCRQNTFITTTSLFFLNVSSLFRRPLTFYFVPILVFSKNVNSLKKVIV